MRGLGLLDFAGLLVLVNELFTGNFLWVEWICLGHLGNKGAFEIDGMVEWSSGGKFPCFGFIEHLGKLGILWGEFMFDLGSGLG